MSPINIEDLSKICLNLPGTTQDIKWENHLCFNVGDKMFLIMGLDAVPTTASFKASQQDFDELCSLEGFQPAPYMARYKWVHVDDIRRMPLKRWQSCIELSYHVVASKLSQKKRRELKIDLKSQKP